MKRAALEQLRLSEEISTAEPQPLFLPMWAYCYGRLGRSARRGAPVHGDGAPRGSRHALLAPAVGPWRTSRSAISAVRSNAGRAAADAAARHELDEGFFNLMALRANVTNDDVLRQREFADVLGKIKGE